MIPTFMEEYRWLSNFHPVTIAYEGLYYPSVENAYQAAKFPSRMRGAFLHCTAAKAKRLGRQLPHCNDDWDCIKLDVMYELVRIKFQDPELRDKLLATGDQELVEGNTWFDTFWGVSRGVGHNHLGKIIMKVRNKIL